MLRADLYFEDNLFHICVEIIKREEGVIMYWCCVYGKRVESYYCIRVDDNPLIITSSTNTNPDFEKHVLDCIDEIECVNADNMNNKILQSY